MIQGSRLEVSVSYRLNRPTGDESTMLLSVSDFEDMAKRAVPESEKVNQSYRWTWEVRGLGLRLVVSTEMEESKLARSSSGDTEPCRSGGPRWRP